VTVTDFGNGHSTQSRFHACNAPLTCISCIRASVTEFHCQTSHQSPAGKLPRCLGQQLHLHCDFWDLQFACKHQMLHLTAWQESVVLILMPGCVPQLFELECCLPCELPQVEASFVLKVALAEGPTIL